MDKYEFNIKVEQIKKLVNRGDYETAMKIADTIDWHRVRNASLLSMIAQIYEKNKEYQEAKDILLLAFERAPIGKRLLYKLADLALREGSVSEAEAYYREFCDLAQDDPRQYLLRYLILKAKNAPVDQLIRALETYTSTEVDEKWLYELAELYHQAGMGKECVGVCDRIMLLFGLGKYVDKAMDLKLQYEPLNKYQMDLVENRDKYEAKLRAVEEEYSGASSEDYEEPQKPLRPKRPQAPAAPVEDDVVVRLHEDAQTQKLAREMSRISEEDMHTANIEEDDEADTTRMLDDIKQIKEIKPTKRVLDAAAEREAAKEAAQQEAAEAEAEEDEIEGTEAEEEVSAEEEREIERQRAAIRAAKEREEMEEEALRRVEDEREAARKAEEERRAKKQAEIDRERALRGQVRNIPAPEEDDLEFEELPETNHLMIEAKTEEEGLSAAVRALKRIHKELGSKNPVAKISSEKLNKLGISAVAAKLEGKDLVIEHAAGLTTAVQNELDDLMEKDQSGMIVVLIDTPEHMEYLHGHNTSLASKFQYIGTDQEPVVVKEVPEERTETDTAVEDALMKQTAAQEKLARTEVRPGKRKEEPQEEPQDPDAWEEDGGDSEYDGREDDFQEKAPAKKKLGLFGRKKKEKEAYDEEPEYEEAEYDERPAAEASRKPAPKPEVLKEEAASLSADDYDDETEMDLDEFAQYACKYASEIDCSITGKSLLALYERIEMMEEDGVPLTKRNAVDLIEEAADKAEKPSFGRKITGLFSPKYDKDGYLILHENNFFD